jgi:hypothetical protein
MESYPKIALVISSIASIATGKGISPQEKIGCAYILASVAVSVCIKKGAPLLLKDKTRQPVQVLKNTVAFLHDRGCSKKRLNSLVESINYAIEKEMCMITKRKCKYAILVNDKSYRIEKLFGKCVESCKKKIDIQTLAPHVQETAEFVNNLRLNISIFEQRLI